MISSSIKCWPMINAFGDSSTGICSGRCPRSSIDSSLLCQTIGICKIPHKP